MMQNILLVVLSLLVFCLPSINGLQQTSITMSRLYSRMNVGSSLTMKKGRGVPIDQRGEYLKRKKLMDQQEKMNQSRPKDVPMFRVFVRAKAGGMWIPVGDLAGDQRATALVNAYMSGFLTEFYKGQMDRGVARSVFQQEDTFVKTIKESFRPFKNYTKDMIQFGYKVEFEGLEEKMGEQKVTLLEKGMEKGWFDNLKDGLGNMFNPVEPKNEETKTD